jgi:hypothetical protein
VDKIKLGKNNIIITHNITAGVRVTYEKSVDRSQRSSASGLADASMAELLPLQQTWFNGDDGERIKQIVCFRFVPFYCLST